MHEDKTGIGTCLIKLHSALPYQHASEDLADYYREQFPAGGPK